MLRFIYEKTAKTSADEVDAKASDLAGYLEKIRGDVERGNDDDPEAFLSLPSDEKNLKEVKDAVEKLGGDRLRYVVVVGIGGSNLGTKAVYEATLWSRNKRASKAEMLFVDTVDAKNTNAVLEKLRSCDKSEAFVLVVVSKSGKTTETIANSAFLHRKLGEEFGDISSRVVCITDEGSALWHLAGENQFLRYPIPKKVGGRYSVFSLAGLLPLSLCGVDVISVLEGAKKARSECLSLKPEENPALSGAILIFLHYQKGRLTNNLFLFDPALLSVGNWWRQLVGESLGKEYNTDGEKVDTGILPIVSIGSTDLHSMGQLYLGGPKKEFTIFVRAENADDEIEISGTSAFSDILPDLQGKNFSFMMNAIFDGVKKAYQAREMPFCEIELSDLSENSIGAFLQMKMMETMYLGKLLNINPFDQPNVEEYKDVTRKLLSE